jgi:hypothetical protein
MTIHIAGLRSRFGAALLSMGTCLIPVTAWGYSDGPATVGTVDGTGSPRSGGSCAQCHGSETQATQVSVRLYDMQGAAMTQPIQGGDSYIVELQVSHATFTQFGAQLSAFDGSGSLSTGFFFGGGENPETQIADVFGQQFMENNGRSSSGIFRARWTAPIDQEEVVFYYSGVAVNGSGRGGDRPSPPASSTFDIDVPCIDVDADMLCDNLGDDDDDNDGVPDLLDRDPADPTVCADADEDGCEDCSVGRDGLGPMSDQRTDEDGADTDGDGVCDLTDVCLGQNDTGDVDSDGVCGDQDVCVGDDALGDVDGDGVCGGAEPEPDMGQAMDMGHKPDMPGELDMGSDSLPDMIDSLPDMYMAPGDMHAMHDAGAQVIKEPVGGSPPADDGGCQTARGGTGSPFGLLIGLAAMCWSWRRRRMA